MAAHKKILFRAAAKEKLLRGAATLADAVRVTLGPKSKCVLIQKSWGAPLVCDDGVTIAKEMSLADPDEDLGAQLIRQAAERTGEAVGDGTSTSTILAHAIFAEGLKNVAAGAGAIDLKRGLDRGLRAVVASLQALSRPVSSKKEKAQAATISAHGDHTIGDLVADALERVGGDGVISVEEAKGTETKVEVVEGMQIDHGFLSPYFVTEREKLEVVLEEPLILLSERKISSAADLVPLLEQVVREGKPLLVIADDVDGEALAVMVLNRIRGVLACAAVKAPGYGDRRKEMLEDMAVLTGGQVVAEALGSRLEHVKAIELGRARRVVVGREATKIIGGGGERRAIDGRIAEIRRQIETTKSDYDKEKLQERVAKLAGGVAVVRVGAPSEVELKSRKEALEDSISSTKAAIAEGLIPGGGLALLRATEALEREEAACEGDERTGVRILRRALEAPARQIAENSGVDGGVVVDRLRTGKGAHGFDAARLQYVDLLEAGIVDATKVVRIAVENAVSVAGMLLLAEATLTEIPEKKAERMPALPEAD